MRDLLIGAVPPASVVSWKPLRLLGAGLVTFLASAGGPARSAGAGVRCRRGLGTFAVAGAAKALAYGLPPVMAALLGMVTGIGGGMVRDVLAAEVPVVLKADLRRRRPLGGNWVVVAGWMAGLPATPTAIVGLALCCAAHGGDLARRRLQLRGPMSPRPGRPVRPAWRRRRGGRHTRPTKC